MGRLEISPNPRAAFAVGLEKKERIEPSGRISYNVTLPARLRKIPQEWCICPDSFSFKGEYEDL